MMLENSRDIKNEKYIAKWISIFIMFLDGNFTYTAFMKYKRSFGTVKD